VPGDVGHLNITWHHDWWADNVNQRMPRSRYGKIHMLNNLFTAVGDSYCSNSGLMATLLVEANVYSGVKAPLQLGGGDILAPTTGAGANLFMNTTGLTTSAGVGFVPPYAYTPDDTATLAAAIMAGAGPH
jgi:pectate lyase